MAQPPESTLSEDEFATLDAFLLSDACGDEALSIDEAHGFISAVEVGPEPLEDEKLLAAIWGEPDFADEAERRRMCELVLRLRDEIVDTFRSGRRFEPLVIEEEEDGELFEVYEGWCLGFMLGVEPYQAEWEALPRAEQELLAPMAQLALLNDDESQEMEEEEYLSWIELIPGAVKRLYAYWHGGS